jgi:hypothetical protein
MSDGRLRRIDSGTRLAELALLAAALLAPLLPPLAALAVLSVLGILWMRSRPPRREQVVGVVALALGLAALVAGGLAARWAPPPAASSDLGHEQWQYSRLWEVLRRGARWRFSTRPPARRHRPRPRCGGRRASPSSG